MEFQKFVFPVLEEQANELANQVPDVNNVLIGIKPDFYFTMFSKEERIFHFIYINCQHEYNGYLLQLKFKQSEFYNHILSFSFYLSLEFKSVDPVQVYNSFLYQVRSGLEQLPIQTVSTSEMKQMEQKYGDPQGILMSPFGIEIIPYLEKKEFYQNLLGVDESQKVEHGKKYVYLILNSRNGFFKIGRSKNPLRREKTLQSEEPEILLLKFWEAESLFERQLHRNFMDKRIRGEWFRLTIGDLFKLKDLIAAT